MSADPENVIRSQPPYGPLAWLLRNRDKVDANTPGKLIPNDLTVITGRGIARQWQLVAGLPVAHGTVADEAAMLALHVDSAETAYPRWVVPGDSCLRADDPGWRWHCIAGHGTTLADWERRPLAGALADLATSGHTHHISAITGLETALEAKQDALSNTAALARISAVAGGSPLWDGRTWPGGGAGGALTSDSLITVSAPCAWYRSNAGCESASGVAAADGDPVQYWLDQSGNEYHLEQASLESRPVFASGVRNGQPVVRFDGVDDFLRCAAFPSMDLADCTVLAVCSQRAGTADVGIWVIGASGSGEPYGTSSGIYASVGGSSSHFVAGANTAVPALPGSGSTPWAVWSQRLYGGVVTAGKNGLVASSASTSVGSGLTGLLLSAYWLNGPTSFAALDVAELIVFPRAIPDGAIGVIAAGLRAKYGI